MTVAAKNTRLFTLPLATNNEVSSIGGGAGATGLDNPAAFFYQGTGCIYRKVVQTGAGGSGFSYSPVSTYDLTAAATRTIMFKFAVTDFGGLNQTEGVTLLVGQGGNNNQYHDIPLTGTDVAGTALDAYPPKGGFILLPVDPNITAYHRATGSNASLNITGYFGLTARFSAPSAKAENLGMSAIDLGEGLELHTSGALVDLYSFDEGTQSNRFGYCSQLATDTYNLFGTVFVGQSSGSPVATSIFDASRETWQHGDGLFAAGWSGWLFDLSNASTSIALENKTLQGIGTATVEDTRPVFTVTGSAGSLLLEGVVISNYASMTLNNATTINDSSITGTEGITHGGANISGCTFSGSPVASGTAMMTVTSGMNSIMGCNFISGGSGHAIEITTPGSYGWDANTWDAYGADDSLDAVIYNNSGGLVTLNVINGAEAPTVRNGAGASTNVVSGTVTLKVTAQDASGTKIQDARVYVKIQGGLNDGTVVLSGLTDSNGIFQDTGYSYTQDETLVGWVRKSSSSPFYREAQVSGSITSTGFTSTAILIADE